VTREDDAGSLAEQAAAWVPPWSRPAEEPASGEQPVAAEKGPAPEAEWEWDDPETSDTIDIAAELASTEKPVEPVEPEPIEEPVAVLEPEPPLPGEPVLPGEPLLPEEPVEPPVPVEPVEPVEPLLPDEPLMAHVPEGSTVAEEASRASHLDTAAGETQLAVMDGAELKGALEAILLVVDEPVGEIMLAQIIEQPTERIVATLRELAAEYDAQGRGFELRSVAGGWRFYTRTTYAAYVERFVLDGQQVRLTQAALETLAVIAYKQPVTRSRISAIRGVNCDGVVRTLLSRGLIEEMGTEPDSGAHLYRTTTLFLEKLGLNSVDELPPLAPFLPDDVEALADAT
jgi:segregation and condensation protein B